MAKENLTAEGGKYAVLELDQMSDGAAIQAALQEKTGEADRQAVDSKIGLLPSAAQLIAWPVVIHITWCAVHAHAHACLSVCLSAATYRCPYGATGVHWREVCWRGKCPV